MFVLMDPSDALMAMGSNARIDRYLSDVHHQDRYADLAEEHSPAAPSGGFRRCGECSELSDLQLICIHPGRCGSVSGFLLCYRCFETVEQCLCGRSTCGMKVIDWTEFHAQRARAAAGNTTWQRLVKEQEQSTEICGMKVIDRTELQAQLQAQREARTDAYWRRVAPEFEQSKDEDKDMAISDKQGKDKDKDITKTEKGKGKDKGKQASQAEQGQSKKTKKDLDTFAKERSFARTAQKLRQNWSTDVTGRTDI